MMSHKSLKNENLVTVWDPFIRVFHWLLLASFSVAYFSDSGWMNVHSWAGYLVFVLISLRIIWGFIGSKHARFRDFIFSPRAVVNYLMQLPRPRAKRFIGHNPAGGAMILLLIIFVFVTTVSGVLLYGGDAWLGPMAWMMKSASDSSIDLLKSVHEFFANATVFLIVIHVAGVVFESVLHHENLVLSMFTGRKRS